MKKRILVPLADGFEMLEALSIVDVFRRGEALVDTAALGDQLQVTSSHGVAVLADKLLAECSEVEYDLIVLPGGIPGAENLQKSQLLVEMLQKQNLANKLYGAICASPAVVLEPHGLLEGKEATCHPMFADGLGDRKKVGEGVVIDGNCVTSRGAGTSIEFALELLAVLMGEEKRKAVAKTMALEV
jgi:4-methyl-5(b-hydroxyethyl)-thiazole monophosphate biosynthesis